MKGGNKINMTSTEFKVVAKEIGWNNKELAKRLSKSEVTISRYMQGKIAIPGSIVTLMNLYREKMC